MVEKHHFFHVLAKSLDEYAAPRPNTHLKKAGGKAVQNYIRKRAVKVGKYIIRTSATVRQTADVFGISKSTVHKDVSERLPRINKELAEEVNKVMMKNKAERHIRGGEATRQKYISQSQSQNSNLDAIN